MKARDAVEGFHLYENSHKLCRGFQQAMGARTTGFISFIKLLFSSLTKRKTIHEARTVNSHISETANHIIHAIFVLHSAMKHTCRPIKTHVQSKLIINLGCWENTRKVCKPFWSSARDLQLFPCSCNIPRVYCAGKPVEMCVLLIK